MDRATIYKVSWYLDPTFQINMNSKHSNSNPWEKKPWLLTVSSTVTKMVTASRDWAVTWAVIELWPSRDWAVIILKMPWLSCDLAVTELWPSRDWAVTSPWLSCDLSLPWLSRNHWVPEPWPPWSPWAHGELTVTSYFLMGKYNVAHMQMFWWSDT